MNAFPAFYLSLTCNRCDEEILYGPCITTIEHEGLAVIPYNMAAQSSFHCSGCGATNYTSDFDLLTQDEI
jgi:hypothetical protein